MVTLPARSGPGRAGTTLLWMVFEYPIGYAYDSGTVFECQTEYGLRRLGDEPTWRYCYHEHPAIKLTVRCRTCGVRTFTVCGQELPLIGLTRLYCTEAVAEHEVIEVLRWR